MEGFSRLLWVSLGGALGTAMRYLLSLGLVRVLGPAFPYGTLAVNVIGSGLLGALMAHANLAPDWSPAVRLMLTTGVMGGFTTYSTFNYETTQYFRDGAYALGTANLLLTLVLCLAAGIAGHAAGRALSS